MYSFTKCAIYVSFAFVISVIFRLLLSTFNYKHIYLSDMCLPYMKNFNKLSSSSDADAIVYKNHILNNYSTDYSFKYSSFDELNYLYSLC